MDLRLHVDEIHLEYYDIDETELFFRSLQRDIIEDIRKLCPAPHTDVLIGAIKSRFEEADKGA
jgi:hypothetical protein